MAEDTFWAIHAFEAENPDEITFNVGEPIVIIERDDQYGDGWWQGKNIRGEVGLFPKDYTTAVKPNLASESPSEAATPAERHSIQATMTDIQTAIDQQLGPGSAVSRTSSIHLDDDDASPGEWTHANARSLLAQNAKNHLEEQAQAERDAEEARRRDEERFRANEAPPIDVELSDESEGEEEAEDYRRRSKESLGIGRAISAEQATPRPPFAGDDDDDEPLSRLVIPEETAPQLRSAAFYGHSPEPMESQIPLPSTPQDRRMSDRRGSGASSSFRRPSMDESFAAPLTMPSRFSAATSTSAGAPSERQSLRRSSASSLTPAAAAPAGPRPPSFPISPTQASIPERVDAEPKETLQTRTPAQDSIATFQPTTPLSMGSTSSRPHSLSGTGPGSTSATSLDRSPGSSLGRKASMVSMAAPNTWTVDQVVEWAKSKGFDALTTSKFQEHEISGDVLLEFDVATLKEIDLPAFGRRVQIYNAIKELKKSLEPAAAPAPPVSQPLASPSLSGYEPDTPSSRNFSPRDSFSPQDGRNSFGTAMSGDQKRTSDASSLAAPIARLGASLPYSGVGATSAAARAHARHDSEPSAALGKTAFEPAMHGLGLNSSNSMARSQSEGVAGTPPAVPTPPPFRHMHSATSETAESFNTADQALDDVVEEADEPVEQLNPREPEKKSKLRRRSQSSLSPRNSRSSRKANTEESETSAGAATSAPPSPEVSRFGSIRSKNGDRSSSFFPASLRGRKPAPKAPSATSESDKEGKTKRSTRLFGSFGGSSPAPPSNATMAGSNDPKSLISSPLEAGASKMGGNKSDASPQIKQQSSATALSGSKSTPGTPKRQGSRPISAAASPQTKSSAVSAPVEGQDIMKKIGTPELTGWLRKKSERYNTWKMRYMVLKGRHLYAMKSATETRVKGWVDLAGYKVLPDADSSRGHYGFKLTHSSKPPHYFSSEDPTLIRKFMKALMKSSITRDYAAPVLSSNNIQTITLAEAQAMFPPPRPPSPTSRARAQKLRLAESNPNTLTPKDAEILMSLQKPNVPIAPPRSNQRAKRESKAASMLSFGSGDNSPGLDSPSILFPAAGQTPPSPTANSRFVPSSPTRRLPDPPPVLPPVATVMSPKRDANSDLLDWVNSRLPPGTPKATNFTTSWRSGQLILRLAEVLSGRVKPGLDDAKFARIKPDSDEELDVGFDVYDFLTLDLAIETGDVSLGELMRGERQQIIKLVEAVRTKYGA